MCWKYSLYISQFSRDYIENHNEDSDGGFLTEVDVQYLKKNPYSSQWFTFFAWKMNIENVEKLVDNLHDKQEHVILIENLKQSIKWWISIERSLESD